MADVDQTPESSRTVSALGKYLILAELGKGGMAEVYLALARGLNGFSKKVVLKLLRTHLAEDDEFLEMFLAEARLAARLNHPNVVQTYEVGLEGGRHCIVMEYLEGRSLAEIEHTTRDQKMPMPLVVRILADSLAGLHYAHQLADIDGQPLELVHRDVSPHNIFVTYDGQVKVLDFGIAKAANSGSRTKTGVFKGKVRYTAPERFSGEDTDRRSDIFSVGVMLWQALTGKRLWPRLNDMAIMHQLANGAPIPRPSELDASIPVRLDDICMKALAYSPANRFQTASEFQDALEEFLSGESVGTTSRQLGKFMSERFAEARAQFQRAIDDQMRIAATLPEDPLSGSLSRIRIGSSVPVLGVKHASSGSLSLDLGSVSRVTSAPAPPLLSSMAPAMRSEAPVVAPRRTRGGGWLVVLMLALVGVLGATAFLLRGAGPLREQDGRTDRAGASESKRTPSPGDVAPAASGPAPEREPASTSASSPSSTPTSATPLASDAGEGLLAIDAGPGAARRTAPVVAPTQAAAPASRGGAVQPPRKVAPPAPEPPRPAPVMAAPPRPEPPRREADCSSPYYVDDQGTKKIRPECL
jgi:serine/threonine protein kinase